MNKEYNSIVKLIANHVFLSVLDKGTVLTSADSREMLLKQLRLRLKKVNIEVNELSKEVDSLNKIYMSSAFEPKLFTKIENKLGVLAKLQEEWETLNRILAEAKSLGTSSPAYKDMVKATKAGMQQVSELKVKATKAIQKIASGKSVPALLSDNDDKVSAILSYINEELKSVNLKNIKPSMDTANSQFAIGMGGRDEKVKNEANTKLRFVRYIPMKNVPKMDGTVYKQLYLVLCVTYSAFRAGKGKKEKGLLIPDRTMPSIGIVPNMIEPTMLGRELYAFTDYEDAQHCLDNIAANLHLSIFGVTLGRRSKAKAVDTSGLAYANQVIEAKKDKLYHLADKKKYKVFMPRNFVVIEMTEALAKKNKSVIVDNPKADPTKWTKFDKELFVDVCSLANLTNITKTVEGDFSKVVTRTKGRVILEKIAFSDGRILMRAAKTATKGGKAKAQPKLVRIYWRVLSSRTDQMLHDDSFVPDANKKPSEETLAELAQKRLEQEKAERQEQIRKSALSKGRKKEFDYVDVRNKVLELKNQIGNDIHDNNEIRLKLNLIEEGLANVPSKHENDVSEIKTLINQCKTMIKQRLGKQSLSRSDVLKRLTELRKEQSEMPKSVEILDEDANDWGHMEV